jgi:hypothetical protein
MVNPGIKKISKETNQPGETKKKYAFFLSLFYLRKIKIEPCKNIA